MMKTKVVILSLIAILYFAISANARWRIGVTAGASCNNYSINTEYMGGVQYEDAWGSFPGKKFPIGTFGLMAQYDILHWLGIRSDLNCTFKNHKMSISQSPINYEVNNNYIQLPIMASFSVGYKKIRGFINLGIYGAYWLSSHKTGTENVLSITKTGVFKNDFNKNRDQRFDCGLMGGLGMEWRLKENWVFQILEARIYYSTQSIQKHYMKANEPRYNTTFTLQSGLCYLF